MTHDALRALLDEVRRSGIGVDDAANAIERANGYVHTTDAVVDTDRAARCGLPEVIFCEAKSPEQIAAVARVLLDRHGVAFGTRCSADKVGRLIEEFGDAVDYHDLSRTVRIGRSFAMRTTLTTAILAAGTSDLFVAEEAARTLETFGAPVERAYDVGVAGVHRLLARRELLERAGAVIVVAGMEGALPSVVGGLTGRPVVAVPTSIGYGAAMGGFTALFGMLTSCASGITVVNIDNGFGAAAAVMRMLRFADSGMDPSDGAAHSENNSI